MRACTHMGWAHPQRALVSAVTVSVLLSLGMATLFLLVYKRYVKN